jgi:hypothetical protein
MVKVALIDKIHDSLLDLTNRVTALERHYTHFIDLKPYRQFKISDTHYLEQTGDVLNNVSWYITDPLADAKDQHDRTLNLTERVFQGPVLMLLSDRYGHTEWMRPIINTTVGGILQAIHDHYKEFEEDAEEGMGDAISFQGLHYDCDSPGVWSVRLES